MYIYIVTAYNMRTQEIHFHQNHAGIAGAYNFYRKQIEGRGRKPYAFGHVEKEVKMRNHFDQHLFKQCRIVINRQRLYD